jgi:hypothetical protein
VENMSHGASRVVDRPKGDDFLAILAASTRSVISGPPEGAASSQDPPSSLTASDGVPPAAVSRKAAAASYERHAHEMSGLEKYKDDQLLLHPGGDHYYPERNQVIPDPAEQKSFWGRVGKDLSDAFGNMKNFFHDFLFGAEIRYRDESGAVQSANRKGLIGSVVDFFKDLGSAFTLGAWRPDGEPEPRGFMQTAGFFVTKVKEAFFGDLAQGILGSAIHMGKDLILAGWNLLEVVPDATVGNLEQGRKATTAVFDTGQVTLDYLTDIVPFGDAWVRVHSMDLKGLDPPLLQNIRKGERSTDDLRWKYIRNTAFRKGIETVGALLMDLLTLKILGHTKLFSDERK